MLKGKIRQYPIFAEFGASIHQENTVFLGSGFQL